MAIYDNLPYTNFHELNADWLLKQMKEAKAKVDSIQEDIDQFNEDYAALAAVFTVAGNNVSIPGTMTANGFIGNLTGNVSGNASTAINAGHATSADSATNADHATTADSATTATNATNATNATTATNATNAVNATNASNADYATMSDFSTNANLAAEATQTKLDTALSSSTDANDFMPSTDGLHVYQVAALNTNVPRSQQGEAAVLLTIRYGTDHVLQVAWFYVNSQDLFYRQKYYSSWQGWYQITKSSAV